MGGHGVKTIEEGARAELKFVVVGYMCVWYVKYYTV